MREFKLEKPSVGEVHVQCLDVTLSLEQKNSKGQNKLIDGVSPNKQLSSKVDNGCLSHPEASTIGSQLLDRDRSQG